MPCQSIIAFNCICFSLIRNKFFDMNYLVIQLSVVCRNHNSGKLTDFTSNGYNIATNITKKIYKTTKAHWIVRFCVKCF